MDNDMDYPRAKPVTVLAREMCLMPGDENFVPYRRPEPDKLECRYCGEIDFLNERDLCEACQRLSERLDDA